MNILYVCEILSYELCEGRCMRSGFLPDFLGCPMSRGSRLIDQVPG